MLFPVWIRVNASQDFIERAEAAGHDHVGLGVFHEHYLAREEVLEGEDDVEVVVGVLLCAGGY